MTVVRSHGVREDGSFGLVGHRAHCPRCSFLSDRLTYNKARKAMSAHNADCQQLSGRNQGDGTANDTRS